MYFTIKSAIAIPERSYERRGKWKTKFANMEPGDSFLVADIRQAISAYNSATRLGYHVTIRRVGNGYRVWKLFGR